MFLTRSDEATMHPVLSKLAIMYPQDGLVADQLCPVVSVEDEEGYFLKFNADNLQGGIEDLCANGARANSIDWKTTKDTYACEEFALEKPLSWRDLQKYKRWMDIAKTSEKFLLEILFSNKEVRVATLLTTTSNYYSSSHYVTLAGTQCWDDFTNSDPEADVETGREVVALAAGEPNAIAIPVNIWRKIRRHPAIRAIIKDTNSSQLTEDGFPKKLWGLNALFPGARQNTAAPGASESVSRIWSDNVWLGIVNPRPDKETMSFAYTFTAEGRLVETYEDRAKKSDVLRVRSGIEQSKIVCSKAGYVIKNVLA